MGVSMLDIGAYLASVVLIGGYHLYLRLRLRQDCNYTIQSVSNNARTAWVENIMTDKSSGILAVQTLRNSTMAATFLASTAILMSMGVLNLMQKTGSGDSMLHSLQQSLMSGGDFENLKVLLLLGTLFWAFFSFSMAVRLYNHVGYLINSTNAKYHFNPSTGYVSELLNRSASFYTYGMRAYYISVPMIISLYSPYYTAIASIGLVVFLYNIDRAPAVQMAAENTSPVKPQNKSLFALHQGKQDAADPITDFGVIAKGVGNN